MAAPTSRPKPVDEVEHARGTPASCKTSAKISADVGVYSEGFSTMVQPAARAGATLQAIGSAASSRGGGDPGHAQAGAEKHRGTQPLLERIGLEHLKRGHQMAEPGGGLGALGKGQRRAVEFDMAAAIRRTGPCRPR